MAQSLNFTPADRILVLAPHPDDESLATGGLLQRAASRGAQVRVLFISDGDNNPWPQRFMEKRLHIGATQRAQWGARRRAEAVTALQHLGVPHSAVRFLGWPDQGTTESLLRAEDDHVAILAEELNTWRPTLVVAPSLHDVHPDHNALAVQLEIAIDQLAVEHRPALLRFFVHQHGTVLPHPKLTLHLTESERRLKESAILCHKTQMALSRRRFTAYARPGEHFFPTDAAQPGHPIHSAVVAFGALVVQLRPSRIPFLHGDLLVASESLSEGSVRWRVPLSGRSRCVNILEARRGKKVRRATLRRFGNVMEIRLPIAPIAPVARVFIKFDRRLSFYDEAGWREVPVLSPEFLTCSDLPPSETSRSSSWSARLSFGGASAGSV